jgi:hypothetical protein
MIRSAQPDAHRAATEIPRNSGHPLAPSNEGGNVDSPFKILRMDPETMQMTQVLKSGVYGVMGGGTGAIEVDDKLWVSTMKWDRIAIFPMKSKNG